MKIYFDNCCLNRPFDNQEQIRIKLESEAKLYLQEMVIEKQIELVWSYIIDFENTVNPFEERKRIISKWKKHAKTMVTENAGVIKKANSLLKLKVKPKDALHISCAINAGCDYFITTDDGLLKKTRKIRGIVVIDPVNLIREMEL